MELSVLNTATSCCFQFWMQMLIFFCQNATFHCSRHKYLYFFKVCHGKRVYFYSGLKLNFCKCMIKKDLPNFTHGMEPQLLFSSGFLLWTQTWHFVLCISTQSITFTEHRIFYKNRLSELLPKTKPLVLRNNT